MSKDMKSKLREEYYGFGGAENKVSADVWMGVSACLAGESANDWAGWVQLHAFLSTSLPTMAAAYGWMIC